MLAPLKASPSQPTGKAAKRRRADIGAASEAVSLGMLRLVEQDVAGAGQLERRREPKAHVLDPARELGPLPSSAALVAGSAFCTSARRAIIAPVPGMLARVHARTVSTSCPQRAARCFRS